MMTEKVEREARHCRQRWEDAKDGLRCYLLESEEAQRAIEEADALVGAVGQYLSAYHAAPRDAWACREEAAYELGLAIGWADRAVTRAHMAAARELSDREAEELRDRLEAELPDGVWYGVFANSGPTSHKYEVRRHTEGTCVVVGHYDRGTQATARCAADLRRWMAAREAEEAGK